MADHTRRAMQHIRNHVDDTRSDQDASMHLDVPTSADFEKRLDCTISELQSRVQDQRAALDELMARSMKAIDDKPSPDKRARVCQLNAFTDMYKALIQTEPHLPPADSLLPAVLAVSVVQDTIVSTKQAVADTRAELSAKQQLLTREKAELEDDFEVQRSIANRVGRLRKQQATAAQTSPHEVANQLVGAMQKRKIDLEADTVRLHDALIGFISDHLGAMLAAEELGGPVVGALLDIDDETLAQKTVSAKAAKYKPLGDTARQNRIELVWGHTETADGMLPRTESDAAGRDFHLLVERLIEGLLGRTSAGAYVDLERESAAARFLVRAKVAQLHPKDARRLRLVDFGRELT